MLKSNTYNSKLHAKINNSHVKFLHLNYLKSEQTRIAQDLMIHCAFFWDLRRLILSITSTFSKITRVQTLFGIHKILKSLWEQFPFRWYLVNCSVSAFLMIWHMGITVATAINHDQIRMYQSHAKRSWSQVHLENPSGNASAIYVTWVAHTNGGTGSRQRSTSQLRPTADT